DRASAVGDASAASSRCASACASCLVDCAIPSTGRKTSHDCSVAADLPDVQLRCGTHQGAGVYEYAARGAVHTLSDSQRAASEGIPGRATAYLEVLTDARNHHLSYGTREGLSEG